MLLLFAQLLRASYLPQPKMPLWLGALVLVAAAVLLLIGRAVDKRRNG